MKKYSQVFLTYICVLPLASSEIIPGREKKNFQVGQKNFCLSVSGCWRCNANWRTQNASPFLHHKETAQCYGNSCKVFSL